VPAGRISGDLASHYVRSGTLGDGQQIIVTEERIVLAGFLSALGGRDRRAHPRLAAGQPGAVGPAHRGSSSRRARHRAGHAGRREAVQHGPRDSGL